MKPFYSRDNITIYCGDNRRILAQLIQDNTIDLVVTSPPYDNLDADLDPIPGGLRTYNGYTWDFKGLAAELWRTTARGGVVVWVVGDATIDGSETGASFRQALYFRGLGFNVETMIYTKNGQGATGSNDYYWQDFEFMFVFGKGKLKTTNLIRDRKNKTSPSISTESQGHRHKNGTTKGYRIINRQEYGIRFNIWEYHEAGTRINHPAIFPETLARDHIISWSNPGDLVADPFLGSGTTAKMAQQLGRRFIGIEISESYCRIAVERLRQPSFFSLPELQKAEKAVQLGFETEAAAV